MEKSRRSERMAAITRMLTAEPGKLFTLREFAEKFGCARSTLSEDIAMARSVLLHYGLGTIESTSGAAGGARFLPFASDEADLAFAEEMLAMMRQSSRILPGDFLYTVDLFSDPSRLRRMGEIFAKRFYCEQPDAVFAVESMGVPIALFAAQALGKPLVTARRDNRMTEGSVVTLNYMSESSNQLQTLSLPRRSLKSGRRVLVIDDFMRGGGTASAMCEMVREFNCEVAGLGVILATAEPENKRVHDYVSLFVLQRIDEMSGTVEVDVAPWLKERKK